MRKINVMFILSNITIQSHWISKYSFDALQDFFFYYYFWLLKTVENTHFLLFAQINNVKIRELGFISEIKCVHIISSSEIFKSFIHSTVSLHSLQHIANPPFPKFLHLHALKKLPGFSVIGWANVICHLFYKILYYYY